MGSALQRLFSTFPNSWPGVGLLILRLCLGLRLMYISTAALVEKPPEPAILAQNMVAAAGAVLLLGGLWTPIAGTLVALDEAGIALSLPAARLEDMFIPIFLAVLSVSVAMLGPGAWSIDARLFGRKRFDIDRSRKHP